MRHPAGPREGTHVRAAALAVVLLWAGVSAAGCSGGYRSASAERISAPTAEAETETSTAPRAATDPTESDDAPPPSPVPRRGEAAGGRDAAILETLVAFARAPGKRTWSAVPFAERVRLGLGKQLLERRPARELRAPGAWRLHVRSFRAYVGPFSALELVADEPRLAFAVGPYMRCASPPATAPGRLRSLRRLSIQPRRVESCLQWFAVDVFVTRAGEIEAVTLDLWEP
jgi:hypothetical protein